MQKNINIIPNQRQFLYLREDKCMHGLLSTPKISRISGYFVPLQGNLYHPLRLSKSFAISTAFHLGDYLKPLFMHTLNGFVVTALMPSPHPTNLSLSRIIPVPILRNVSSHPPHPRPHPHPHPPLLYLSLHPSSPQRTLLPSPSAPLSAPSTSAPVTLKTPSPQIPPLIYSAHPPGPTLPRPPGLHFLRLMEAQQGRLGLQR